MRGLFGILRLLKRKIENVFLTALRKQKIRRAYRGGFYIHPFFTVLFVMLAALVASVIFLPPKIAEFIYVNRANYVVSDTAFPVLENLDEAAVFGEGFLEPFAVVSGMGAMRYMIVVDKFHRILYLLRQGPRRWGVVRVYPVAVGENEGAKLREGDRRTPQGLYFMVRHRHQTEMVRSYGRAVAAQFGPHAFVLNYPNRHDRAARRTGSGIWIHGTFDNTIPIVSRGCVSMHNTYVEELFGFIGDGLLTPVILIEERYSDLKNLIDLDEIWQERLLVAEEFGIDPFTNVPVGRENVPQLPFPGVEVQPITLTPQASIAPPANEITLPDERQRRLPPVVDMEAQRNQRTPPVRPTRTRQTNEQVNEQAPPTQTPAQNQITQVAAQQNVQTQAQPAQMTPPLTVQQTPQAPQQQAVQQQASAPTQTALAPPQQNVAVQPPQPIAPASAQRSERGIIQFVNDWARAWESRDLERYSRFYDAQNFPDWRAFRANKQNIFGSVNSISVILDNINVVSMSENASSVRFNQLYETERSRFFSRKQLDLVWHDGGWRIVNEFVVR